LLWNAALLSFVVPRSARQAAGAFALAAARSRRSSRALAETHLPNALRLLALVPYLAANASRVAAVAPRS
jgi:hypothetical protein